MEIVTKIESNELLSPQEKKGIKGRSIFLDIPYFHFVRDFPVDYLHGVCLGLIKKLVMLTFDVGVYRVRNTTRKLSKPADFNALMETVKTPRESSRRARDLDFAVFKGAEFRNLSLFYFPFIIQCIEEDEEEIKLWLYLAYMIRSCVIPGEEFNYVDLHDVEQCCKHFYEIYEKLFGKGNCTYNTHVVCSHLMEMRHNGPLTSTSTFAFESFYGDMRNAFVPGTTSPLKQIMTKILMKRILEHHCCELPIFFSPRTSSLEDNSLIYCWNHDKHDMYLIKEIMDDGENFICKKLETVPHVFQEIPPLNWSRIGVYLKGPVQEEDVVVRKKDVSGKVIQVGKYVMTWPYNVLREK